MRKLPPTSLRKHEYECMTWSVTLPYGVAFERALDPAFWCHHAGTIKRGDEVVVRAQDFSFRALLVVMDVAVDFVRMRVHSFSGDAVQAAATDIAIAEQAAASAAHGDKQTAYPCVDFKTATKWRVLGFEGNTVKQGLATKADAERELESYVKRAGTKAKVEEKAA